MILDNNYKQGFTIVELALSMSIVSVLLIAIVTMSIQMGRIYTKGATMLDLTQLAERLMPILQGRLTRSHLLSGATPKPLLKQVKIM